jgi:hypothetical protein
MRGTWTLPSEMPTEIRKQYDREMLPALASGDAKIVVAVLKKFFRPGTVVE